MRLKKPPYPEVIGTAAYYRIQTDHRRTALEAAIHSIDKEAAGAAREIGESTLELELNGVMRDWVIETLVQGAFIREYHIWEKSTKEYFNGQHQRQTGLDVAWRSGSSHIEKIRTQIETFSVSVSDAILDELEAVRIKVNQMKHDSGMLIEHFVQWDDLDALMTNVVRFWDELDAKEDFTLSASRL